MGPHRDAVALVIRRIAVMTNIPPLVVAVVGPTASGKSNVAAGLARCVEGELVSADSRQLYRGMAIGTAQFVPPKGVTQHLVGVLEPDEEWTLKQYQREAFRLMAAIHGRRHVPILVGGTGLYIDAVLDNWVIPPVSPSVRIRARYERVLRTHGVAALADELKRIDPLAARVLDQKNPRRLIRALEVMEKTGVSVTAQRTKRPPRYRAIRLGCVPPDDYPRVIRARVRRMIRAGLIDEARRLFRRYDSSLPSLSGIGYAEARRYLAQECSRQELEDDIVRHTLKYAKRQMTWFRRDSSIHWVHTLTEAKAVVRNQQ